MTVYWATRLRGFLRHMSEKVESVDFVSEDRYYEVINVSGKIKSKLIRTKLFDYLGLFQIIRISDKGCDCYGSFNRFLKTDKPYFIYLENPTALYHYSLGRLKYPTGRKRFQAALEDPNLKYIVCMADACRDTFEKVNMPLPESVKMKTIYPIVPRNIHISEEKIMEQSWQETLECLFCVQGKRFLTKGGMDVLEAVSRLVDAGCRIHLTVITKLEELDKETLNKLCSCPFVTLHDFCFPYAELEMVYAATNVLLQPSSDDSCSLTIFEAMKGGCAIIGSRLYAFPEMVEEGGNGILVDPKYWMFTSDNIPNPAAWNRRKKLKLSGKRDEMHISRIENAIRELYTDRDKLCRYACRSLELANTKFAEETLCEQWDEVWMTLAEKGKK